MEEEGPTLSGLVAERRWSVRSAGLGGAVCLEAHFDSNGSFDGMLFVPPGDVLQSTQPVRGSWNVAGSLLVLNWDAISSSMTFNNEVAIEITNASDNKLSGVDKYLRLWEFERIE